MAFGAAALAFLLLVFFAFGAEAADQIAIACPTPGDPCKVLILSPSEEQLLIRQNGVFDTASAGRYIDLGNVVAYFRMRLMQAPAGVVQPLPKPAPSATPTPSPSTAPAAQPTESEKHD